MHFADNTSWVLIFLCSEIKGSDASSITGWSLVLWISFCKLRLEIFCCSFSHPIISVSLFWFLRLNSNISVYFSLIFVLFFSFQGSFRVDALFATRSFLILETYDPVLLNRNVKSNFLSVLFYRMLSEQHFTETYAVKCYVLVKSYYPRVPLQSKCFFFLFLRLNVWTQ